MADDTSWMTQAVCRDTPLEWWFDHPKTPEGRANIVRALATCLRCPVRSQCLEWTLKDIYPTDADDVGGIWGGTTLTSRRRIRYERIYARPYI